jgi:hypothetical protein
MNIAVVINGLKDQLDEAKYKRLESSLKNVLNQAVTNGPHEIVLFLPRDLMAHNLGLKIFVQVEVVSGGRYGMLSAPEQIKRAVAAEFPEATVNVKLSTYDPSIQRAHCAFA